jgi:hypothetical protein
MAHPAMDIETLKAFLLWCLLINYGVLLWWFLAFRLAHDWMYRLHRRWFKLSEERFDAIHYQGMAVYKVGVLLLNLTPYLAILIVMK